MTSPLFRGINHHDVCSFYCGTNLCRNADSGAVNTVAAMMRGEVREWMELDRFTIRKVGTEVAAWMQQWHLQDPLVNMFKKTMEDHHAMGKSTISTGQFFRKLSTSLTCQFTRGCQVVAHHSWIRSDVLLCTASSCFADVYKPNQLN